MRLHVLIRKARTRFTYVLFLDYALLKLRFGFTIASCNTIYATRKSVSSR